MEAAETGDCAWGEVMGEISASRVGIGAAAFIGMTVSAPAIFSVNPLLLTPIATEFGWGRATLSSAYLVAAPIMALLYLIVGPALDRFGVRRLVIPGYLAFGVATALLSQLTGSIAQLLALKVLATACGTLVTGVAFGKVVSRHFTANRGLMLGFCLGAGGGLGMTVIPLIGAQILAEWGWRGTYLSVGLFTIIIGLPAAFALPRDSQREEPGNLQAANPGLDAKVALGTSAFHIMLITTLLACMVLNGTLAHTAAIMTDAGLSPHEAAGALSIYAGAMMIGQFSIGILLDRISSPRIALPVFIMVLAGVSCLHFGSGKGALYVGAALVGAGAGSEYGMLPYMLTRFFGIRAFGTLYGFIYAISAIGTGIGPFGMGLAFDFTHSYGRALYIFEAATLLIIALLWRLPAYVFAPDGSVLPKTEQSVKSQAPPIAMAKRPNQA
jgi:MFS family permease